MRVGFGPQTLGFGYIICRVGIKNPTIEVRFEHLNIEAETHVGSRALPTFLNFTANIVEVTHLNWKRKKKKVALTVVAPLLES